MAVLARIKSLDLRQLFVLSGVFLLRPLYTVPTYRATRETVEFCNSRFGKKHHENNRANAVRHALWNFLICERCFKISTSTEKAISWSKKITDLHEKISPNDELEKMMDLHNNKIGRVLYKNDPQGKPAVFDTLLRMMGEAKKVQNVREISNAGNKLVYIHN